VFGAVWQRIIFSARGDPSVESVEFGLEVPANVSVEVFGLQVEPQPGASTYRSSTTGGIYENAYFRDDILSATTIDANRHLATVNIINADHL
jgi:hypothetical protein